MCSPWVKLHCHSLLTVAQCIQVAFADRSAQRDGGVDLSNMRATKSMKETLGGLAPSIVHATIAKQSLETLREIEARTPPRARRVLRVLHDPRRPPMYSEGDLCELPALLHQQWQLGGCSCCATSGAERQR